MYLRIIYFVALVLLLSSCKDNGKPADAVPEENEAAKKMLQGIWLNEDDDEVSMKIKGDTIFYADSTMQAVCFAVINDSLVVKGYNEMRYPIIKQTEHVFQFRNANGDIVKLVKSDDNGDDYAFKRQQTVTLNQRQLIKRDTVVCTERYKFHIYVQVNPSTYKVIRTAYNQDGVQVDNVYYDNIINVCVYNGGNRLFSSDFHKQDFKRYIPSDYLAQSVLSDIILDKVSNDGVELCASVCVPDSPTSYIVRLTVSPEGKLRMKREE